MRLNSPSLFTITALAVAVSLVTGCSAPVVIKEPVLTPVPNTRYVVRNPWTNKQVLVTETPNWVPVEAQHPTRLRVREAASEQVTERPIQPDVAPVPAPVPAIVCPPVPAPLPAPALNKVFFHTGSDVLSENAQMILAGLPKGTYRVTGFADQRGTDTRNQALSARRAERVAHWLRSHGHTVIQTQAQGEQGASSNPADYAADRRVEIQRVDPA